VIPKKGKPWKWRSVTLPSCSTLLTTSSTEVYATLASSFAMPSLTLAPSGTDKFTIQRQVVAGHEMGRKDVC